MIRVNDNLIIRLRHKQATHIAGAFDGAETNLLA